MFLVFLCSKNIAYYMHQTAILVLNTKYYDIYYIYIYYNDDDWSASLYENIFYNIMSISQFLIENEHVS